MATRKTVYLIVQGGKVISIANTLTKLIGKGVYGKQYFYYYRKLAKDEYFVHTYENVIYTIQKISYG